MDVNARKAPINTTPEYNFIVPDDSGHSLEEMTYGGLAGMSQIIRHGGRYAWTLQAYHHLKRRGFPVRLSHGPDPDSINLAHGNLLRAFEKRSDRFTVCIQCDYQHFPLACYHIVQNKIQEKKATSSFIPLWPQIGQIPRNKERRGVRTVAYQGRIDFTDLNVGRLNADLNPHGIEFIALDNWQDLSGIDVLVGIRQYGRKRYKRKPPSKLINAWHAEIPFIGGWDSAYEYIGAPDRDYLRVSSHKELVASIIKLKRNDELYGRIVAAGTRRAFDYTTEAIADRWADVLEKHVLPAYCEWCRKPRSTMVRYHAALVGYTTTSSVKSLLRRSYRIKFIKRLRDLFYDPVG